MLRTVTLFSVLLLAPLAVLAEVTLSGFVQQNTAFNTAGQNPDGRHYKWLEERAQHKLDATGDAWRVSGEGSGAPLPGLVRSSGCCHRISVRAASRTRADSGFTTRCQRSSTAKPSNRKKGTLGCALTAMSQAMMRRSTCIAASSARPRCGRTA